MIIFTHVYVVQRICISSGANNWKVDSGVKRHSGNSNLLLLLLLLLFSRPVFQQCGWNNSYSNLDAFGWNSTSGCSPCTGLPLCSKRISRACSWRVRYPTTSSFFFFCLCTLSLQHSKSSPKLPCSSFFYAFKTILPQLLRKETRLPPRNNFYPSAWRIMLSGDGVMDVSSSFLCLDGWEFHVFALRHKFNANFLGVKGPWAVIHDDEPGESLLHNMEKGR